MDEQIIAVVSRLQRQFQRGVLPWQVQAWLDEPRSESHLRMRMRRLWLEGRLERIGGEGSRRGYQVNRSVMMQVA